MKLKTTTLIESRENEEFVKDDFLYPHQRDAIGKMSNGCILNGGVGSGKSRTSLYYYFSQYGGDVDYDSYTPMSKQAPDLYIITTARKRDTYEWDGELGYFLLSTDPETSYDKHKVFIDSWNNVKNYSNISNAFFIFDEDRVTGSGAWVKAFLKIAKKNKWLVLSATPGDCWSDYIPVFVANGFYKNRTEFNEMHVIYKKFCKFPMIDRYINTRRLIKYREQILVDMFFEKHTILHHIPVDVEYNKELYKKVSATRWDPYKDEPIENASGLCHVLRKVIGLDDSRKKAVLDIFKNHGRLIIFYNFNYECDILKKIKWGKNVEVAEWNGHIHNPLPESDRWVYLVQYNAGAEGWNCIRTNAMVFFSDNYSYKIMTQSAGRIDRLNTLYVDLYFYHLKSKANIDLAISRALSMKKNFNESRFVNK